VNRRVFRYRFHRRSDVLAATRAWASGTSADDSELIDRVVAAYKRSAERFSVEGKSEWTHYFNELHKDIHTVIKENRRSEIEEILRNPASSDLLFGFENISRYLLRGKRLEDRYAPELTLDALTCLAEAVGVRNLENFDDYSRKRPPRIRADDLIDLLERAFGFEILVPNPFPKEYGVLTKRGIMSYRVPQALYQAWRISKLLSGVSNPRVLEIGAGLGRTALYSRQFGIKDYTIIDLPMTTLAQGYFLGRVLGDDSVSLFGETHTNSKERIKILPPECFLKASDRYDLIVNVDSMTEMDVNAARSYWSQIQCRAGVFLSINHESNDFTVRQLIPPDNGWLYTRVPYWMRRGYVEETIAPSLGSADCQHRPPQFRSGARRA